MREMQRSKIIINRIIDRKERANIIRNVVLIMFACFGAFWFGKIYSVNKTQKKSEIVLDKEDELLYGGLKITEKESHIYKEKEFERKYDIDLDYDYDENGRILCTCLEVTNISDQNKTWQDVLDMIDGGFQSDTWASSITPSIGQQMNILPAEGLNKNSSYKLWFSTTMLPVSFKKSTWNHLADEEFYYVLSMPSDKIMIHLDIREVE